MARKRTEDGLPRTKTTVELRDDLLERIPRAFTLTNAIEPLLENWLSNEAGIKIFKSPLKRVYSGDTLAAIEGLANQILDTVAEERDPTTGDGDASDRRTRQSEEAQGAKRGGRNQSGPVKPDPIPRTKKVG